MIKLIFAGRNRIIMIRRELPLTNRASPAKGLSHREERGFSFVLAPAAADLVLVLNCLLKVLSFSYLERFLFLSFMPQRVVDKLLRS